MLSPAGIGLLAGWLTSAGIIAISVAGLLPAWASMPLLLFSGGLAAGLAVPVRPTIGALLGAVTGVFTAVLLTIGPSRVPLHWNSTSLPFRSRRSL